MSCTRHGLLYYQSMIRAAAKESIVGFVLARGVHEEPQHALRVEARGSGVRPLDADA